MDNKIIAAIVLIIIALGGIGFWFVTQEKPDAPTADVVALADSTAEAKSYKQIYPQATTILRKEGCTDGYLSYLKNTDVMRINRNPATCPGVDKYDWIVEYKMNNTDKAGITPALSIAVDRKGKLIDSIFTSPFDDAYLILYDGIYTSALLKKLNTSKISVGNAWGVFEKDNIGYAFILSTFPSANQTGVILYIESYDKYGLSRKETLKTDISDAHRILRAGSNEIVNTLRESAAMTPEEFQYEIYP